MLGAYGCNLSESGSAYVAAREYVNRCLNGLDSLEDEYTLEQY